MASRQKLDAAGGSRRLRLISLLIFLQLLGPGLRAQETEHASHTLPESERLNAAKQAFDSQQWQRAANLTSGPADQSSELDFIHGLALAKLQNWDAAGAAFEAAHFKNSRDPRFLVELAGVRYKQKRLSAAKRNLRSALQLDARDSYTLEFLATLFFLEGNLEAALKYWNRIDKPRLRGVTIEPAPRLTEPILRRSITFNAPQVLTNESLGSTRARLDNLGIFSRQRVDLSPAGDNFDVTLHLAERNGLGNSKLEAILSPLSGLPYSTVYPEAYNLGRRAINVQSLARWDAEKRRFFATLESPLRGDPARRFQVYFDARNENWNLTKTFTGSGSALSDLNLRRFASGMRLRSVAGANWSWSTGLDIVNRSFRNIGGFSPATAAPFFTNSTSFQYWLRADRSLVRMPERRFTLDASILGSAGRTYADNLGAFGSTRAALAAHWLPRAAGDDYETRAQFRTGATLGRVPLDELFQLGIQRDDNDLWLRGHAATAGGRKGAAPLGRRYALANWEFDKNLYSNGIITLKLGTFVDTGAIADSSGFFGSQRWLVDTGAQCKVRVLGVVTVVLIYGRDLRAGRDLFYPVVLH